MLSVVPRSALLPVWFGVAETLAHEVERMHDAQLKVEIEALAGFRDDFLADFLVDKIVVRQGIAAHNGEHMDGELSLRGGVLSLRDGF